MMTAGEIAHALGGHRVGQNSFVARCPAHEDRSPSLSLSDAGELVLWHCHAGCRQDAVRVALIARGLWLGPSEPRPIRATARPAKPPVNPDRSGFAAAIWREGVDPRGSLAEQYLKGRKLALDDDLVMRVLRFHGHCPFGKDKDGRTVHVPALIVAFRPIRNDDETHPPPAIHRIGLKPDGSKLGKQMLGPVAGCAVKLDPDEHVEEGLGICEGIETALAVRANGWRPVCALGSAGAIAKFTPIPGIEALTIFADHDANGVGMAAAKQCAQAWQAVGREVFIRTPHSVGADWLDLQP
ncbi:toprim domain-containing protein [Bradyrhizobium lablabi]|uniref:DUF7146 domain-containing protein n=1 Tax=Bradyrhizobium lablabi TaxID=722472 RepID=UPI001BA89F36|nr:toprim domain-containing protein [Bradyrhizobium lablabi]MBR0698106.1 toprim domain-containing protein [Bradyrhizobium lablabi]